MGSKQVSEFSRRFSAALQGVMRERRVTVEQVANELDRSRGFVSEHTSGKSAPDTDLLDVIARLAGFRSTPALVAEVARRMDDAEGFEARLDPDEAARTHAEAKTVAHEVLGTGETGETRNTSAGA